MTALCFGKLKDCTAVAAGDKNVYFVDGLEAYKEIGVEYCVVDNAHPNDLGFYRMAKTVFPVLKKILESN